MFKKTVIVLIAFIALNIVTIYQFDYADDVDRKDIFSKIYDEAKSIFVKKEIKEQDFFFDISKDDKNIRISGLFKDEKELDKITTYLKIEKSENITLKDGVLSDFSLIEDIKPLVEKMQDIFDGDAKLSFENGEFNLKGVLKDENYKALFESILASIKLPIKNDVNIAPLLKDPELASKEIEEVENILNKDLIDSEDIKDDIVINEITKEVIQENINSLLKEEKINFARASTNLTKNSKIVLEKIANILKDSEFNIEVEGHTDSKGRASLNDRISQDRANSVMNFLINQGIDKTRIKASGYGSRFPIAAEDEQGLSIENRRVEIKIVEK